MDQIAKTDILGRSIILGELYEKGYRKMVNLFIEYIQKTPGKDVAHEKLNKLFLALQNFSSMAQNYDHELTKIYDTIKLETVEDFFKRYNK